MTYCITGFVWCKDNYYLKVRMFVGNDCRYNNITKYIFMLDSSLITCQPYTGLQLQIILIVGLALHTVVGMRKCILYISCLCDIAIKDCGS